MLDEPVPEQLAAKVLELLRQPEVRSRMARAARERYLSEFTQEHADRRIADWLGDVARSRP